MDSDYALELCSAAAMWPLLELFGKEFGEGMGFELQNFVSLE